VIDLFCGAGGLSLGFRAAGCRIIAAVDVDEVAGKTLRRNLAILQPEAPPRVFAGESYDIERITFSEVSAEVPDILIGGPPCQGFSRVGRGKLKNLSVDGFEGDPRNKLYGRFVDAVRDWKPRALVMENVPGMLSVGGVNYAQAVLEELADAGYRVSYAFLNAVWYGVPQYRERIFFIGMREDLDTRPRAPVATHTLDMAEGYRRPTISRTMTLPFGDDFERLEGELPVVFERTTTPAVTVAEALDDLPVLDERGATKGAFRIPRRYARGPHSGYARLMRSWPGFPLPAGIDDHVVRNTPRDHETFRLMRPGDRYPQAIRIARARFEKEIERRRSLGDAPKTDSDEWAQLEADFVPPYREDLHDDKWRKLIPDQPSWTVPAHLARDTYSHIHYDSEQARMISVREAARLQSFPDAFGFAGNMGECFRQIGNAVPPLLAWAIAYRLLRTLGYETVPPPPLAA
jgi:DNA (cytosine-5)-methyltransferase 1